MKFVRLCHQCLNYHHDHPPKCRCWCHLHSAIGEMRYQVKKLGRKIEGFRESLEKLS